MGGKQCVANGGAPFRAKIVINNLTKDLTLKEPGTCHCRKDGCERNHHKGLRMDAGKVVQGEEPPTVLDPLDSGMFAISARESTACGPDGELHYDVWRDGVKSGTVTLYFSRDANSSTRSQNSRVSGCVNNGEYELFGDFPPDTTDCTFTLRKRKVQVRLRGQLSAQFGGGNLDMTVPIEDILKLPELQRLLEGMDQMGAQADKLTEVVKKLQEEGIKFDFVSANKPRWWPF